MLYGPYIKSLKGWDSNRDGLSFPTTTLIGTRFFSVTLKYCVVATIGNADYF